MFHKEQLSALLSTLLFAGAVSAQSKPPQAKPKPSAHPPAKAATTKAPEANNGPPPSFKCEPQYLPLHQEIPQPAYYSPAPSKTTKTGERLTTYNAAASGVYVEPQPSSGFTILGGSGCDFTKTPPPLPHGFENTNAKIEVSGPGMAVVRFIPPSK